LRWGPWTASLAAKQHSSEAPPDRYGILRVVLDILELHLSVLHLSVLHLSVLHLSVLSAEDSVQGLPWRCLGIVFGEGRALSQTTPLEEHRHKQRPWKNIVTNIVSGRTLSPTMPLVDLLSNEEATGTNGTWLGPANVGRGDCQPQ
jgi:hypothetical protein